MDLDSKFLILLRTDSRLKKQWEAWVTIVQSWGFVELQEILMLNDQVLLKTTFHQAQSQKLVKLQIRNDISRLSSYCSSFLSCQEGSDSMISFKLIILSHKTLKAHSRIYLEIQRLKQSPQYYSLPFPSHVVDSRKLQLLSRLLLGHHYMTSVKDWSSHFAQESALCMGQSVAEGGQENIRVGFDSCCCGSLCFSFCLPQNKPLLSNRVLFSHLQVDREPKCFLS
ncbi:hypothetical protein FGO68_gene3229 [Halteria grandinella]|uniref:Uncharacterized protein n=1 Tax=Halteria grandinella TaxID=5974 RepID=A0A8J8NWM0_HALGN|nr:hypothetical protein FGO68_gene3229 [Halteria grandinella]